MCMYTDVITLEIQNLHSKKIKCNDNKQLKKQPIILFHETKNIHFICTQKVENKPFQTIHIYNS